MDNQNIILSVNSFGVIPNIYVTQGDTGRQVTCQITDYQIPDGSTAKFFAKKPSGLQIYNSATVSENTVTFPLTNQTLAEVGVTMGQVEITEPDGKVSTFIFRINVRPTLSGDHPESKNESTYLDDMLEEMQNQLNESIQQGEVEIGAAVQNANTAAQNANTATNNANQATQNANNAAEEANEATEAFKNAVEGTVINDETPSTNTVYSSSKVESELDEIYDLMNGKTVDDNAYSVTVPNGAKFATVKKLGGKSIAWNQLYNIENNAMYNNNQSIASFEVPCGDGTMKYDKDTYSFTVSFDTAPIEQVDNPNTFIKNLIKGHKYALWDTDRNPNATCMFYGFERLSNNPNTTPVFTFEDLDGLGQLILRCRVMPTATPGTVTKRCQLFDLTQMFGAGNEPSTVEEFNAIFPEEYYPYNAGEIVSAEVDEVVEGDNNIIRGEFFDEDPWVNAITETSTEYKGKACMHVNHLKLYSNTENGTLSVFPELTFDANTQYAFRIEWCGTINPSTSELSKLQFIFKYTDGTSRYITNITSDWQISEYVTSAGKTLSDIRVLFNTSAQGTYIASIKMEKGTEITGWPPREPKTYPIPDSIKSLDGYGWSAGDVYNEVDFENKKFIQRVEKVDLGTLTWDVNSTLHFYADMSDIMGSSNNLLCAKYTTVTFDTSVADMPDKTIKLNGTGTQRIHIRDSAYTDSTVFKTAMNGVMLYYELAEPVITDISDILDSFEVESGGTISFIQSDDTKHLPVPTTIEYDSSGADKIAQLEEKIDAVKTTADTAKTTADSALSGVNSLNEQVGDINTEITGINQNITEINSEIDDINAHITAEKDYIVEQGTSGIWTYRKWKSGIAECWGNQDQTVTVEYGVYVPLQIALPFAFAETPIVNVNFGVNGMAGAYMAYTSMHANNQTIMAYGAGVTSADAGKACWFYIHAIGKWKTE